MSAFQDMNQPPVSVPAANDIMENSTANIEPSTSQDVTSQSVSVSVPAANDIMENSTANIEPSTSQDVTSLSGGGGGFYCPDSASSLYYKGSASLNGTIKLSVCA